MSRIAKQPVVLPKGVEASLVDKQKISVVGPKGELSLQIHGLVLVEIENDTLTCHGRDGGKRSRSLAGTTRSLINNMVIGVDKGFEKRLTLIGVGYRAKVAGDKLALTLGFSHPVNHPVPKGIDIETPSNTEIIVKGIDKQQVGQIAADIRAYRPPEPYKGKGVRYKDEVVRRKEAKKK